MQKQKILIIDYDPASISRVLDPLTDAGYEVEVAHDGLAGLDAFTRHQPDLVLVEAMLPKKHGFEVCKEIKASSVGGATPVLITTAVCRGRKYRNDALQTYGCDEYVEKPIEDAQLVELCRRYLDLRPKAAEDASQVATAAPPARTAAKDGNATGSGPAMPALESMSDDEIDARLDAIMLEVDGDSDAPAEVASSLEPEAPAPVATSKPTASVPEISEMTEEELMSQLDSMVDAVVPPGEGAPVVDAAAALPAESIEIDVPPQRPPAIAPSDSGSDWFAPSPPTIESPEQEQKQKPEPVLEQPAPRKRKRKPEPEPDWEVPLDTVDHGGSSKKVWVGIAAAMVLVAAGAGIAWSQGWIGADNPTAATANDSAEPPAFSPERFRPRDPQPEAATGPVEVPATTQPAPSDTGVTALVEPSVPDAVPAAPVEQPVPQAQPPASEPVETARAESRRQDATPQPLATNESPPPSPVEVAAAGEQPAPRRVETKTAPAPRAPVEADPQATARLRAEILSAPVEDPQTAGTGRSSVADTETLIGSPLKPVLRGDLVPFEQVDTLPEAIRRNMPAYDMMAARMRQEGTVVINVLIDETGAVTDVELVSGIPRSRLNDVATRAVRRWTYRPATKDGIPVKVWKTEKVVFKL